MWVSLGFGESELFPCVTNGKENSVIDKFPSHASYQKKKKIPSHASIYESTCHFSHTSKSKRAKRDPNN